MKKHNQWLAAIALTAAVLLAGCGAKSTSDSNATPSKNTSKTISFVKEAKSQGTYVWLELNDVAINKDSVVTAIDTLVNGKLRTYQIFDNDITLGKVSKMSDAATIKLAKAQDKKYATTGAESEIRSWLKTEAEDNGDDFVQVGQERDFDDDARDVAVGNSNIYFDYVDRTSPSGRANLYGMTEQVDKIGQFYPAYLQDKNNDQDVSLRDLSIASVKGGETNGVDLNYGKALLNSIKKTPYQAPKAQTIKVENFTDASGNKLVRQDVTVKHIDFFAKSDVVSKNFYELTKTNPDKFKELVELRGVEADWESAKSSVEDDPDSDANPNQYVTAVNARKTLYNALIKPNYSALVKGVYGYHQWEATNMLSDIVSQQIYKERYIGYKGGSGVVTNLVTKAQTKDQKAVFAK